ncbi:hypothetical protein [Corallococcus sp. AS-1-6]|uniref:hypothetical protein n=1 Tax=Corallococcus sp. AS-1-6 TaxID=2874599 RepID=UPI001CBAAA20|nr:hypothetical protein [Corallococcus sp. AS-1-6]MBZ4375213.1 hypothetical protein [Corallococcus sp. AS-1-6]
MRFRDDTMTRLKPFLLLAILIHLTPLPATAETFDRTFTYEAETDLNHGIGYADASGWAANVASQSTGHLTYGPYATNWGSGAGKAVFRLMVDDTTYNNLTVATIDIYCYDTDKVLATHDILRGDFAHPFQYQDFALWFDLTTCSNQRVETRVRWLDRAFMNIDKVTVYIDDFTAGQAPIENLTDSTNAHVQTLVTRALGGLGFGTYDPVLSQIRRDGPNANDIIFVGKHYMAWIDQTGFYGKMNGLWLLNGATGNALGFFHETPLTHRPINFLGVAEDGNGTWMTGYSGAEHYELPHEIPELGEDPNGNGQCDEDESCTGSACARRICNWYSINEAAPITDPDVPHWTACNRNRTAWARKLPPLVREQTGRSLRIVYQAPITKESDAARDGIQEGDHCHQDLLFADGERRPVYLRLGYVLHGDQPYFDRTYQFDNPAGNPDFGEEIWSVVGGIVLSKFPATQPTKANLFHAVRPDNTLIMTTAVAPYIFPADIWTARRPPASPSQDEVWGWVGTALSWSARGRDSLGDSLKMQHLGPSDNADTGFCACAVHGGMEIGGGVLHRGISVPISGGTRSIEAVRRISFPSGPTPPFIYEAEGSGLSKGMGRLDGDGWSANTAFDSAGYLIYGPYANYWGDGNKLAVFRMMIDVTTTGGNIANIEVYDRTTDTIIASKLIARSAFTQPFAYQDFSLEFSLDGRLRHEIETRIKWYDTSYVKVDRISVLDQ